MLCRTTALALIAWGACASPALAFDEADQPIIAQAKAGPCRMTVQGGGSSFLVIVTGLVPNEPLAITSRSEGEVGRRNSTAQEDRRYGTIVLPLVKGKTFGTASLEVAGQRCRISTAR